MVYIIDRHFQQELLNYFVKKMLLTARPNALLLSHSPGNARCPSVLPVFPCSKFASKNASFLKDVTRQLLISSKARPSPYFVQPQRREQHREDKKQCGEKLGEERRGEERESHKKQE